jgi:hypothetical protein
MKREERREKNERKGQKGRGRGETIEDGGLRIENCG